MTGEREQRRIEADRIALTLEHGAAQIVVPQDPRQAGPCFKCTYVPGQEAIHTGIAVKTQPDLPGPRQHHHEGHQRPTRAIDLQVAKRGPVDFTYFSRRGAKPQVGLMSRARTVERHQVTKMVDVAPVSTASMRFSVLFNHANRSEKMTGEHDVIQLRGQQHCRHGVACFAMNLPPEC